MYKLISNLDTERFGFTVAKISNNIEKPDFIVKELKKMSTKLIIARVDFNNIKLINQLERIGFLYKDAQVTFNFDLQDRLPQKAHNDFNLTNFCNRHFPDIVEMTKSSFKNYGHYFADEKLNKEKCLEIYVDWIKRCCREKEVADTIIVAEKENIAIGYLALKTKNSDNEIYASGVIGAVSPKHRKMGVFHAINVESLYLSKNLNLNRVENNVLITNYPVIKTYTSLSYKIIKSEITMHYWCE